MSWNGRVQVGPIPGDRSMTGFLTQGEQIQSPTWTVPSLYGMLRRGGVEIFCVKTSCRTVCESCCMALGGHMEDSDAEGCGTSKASRSHLEASVPRRSGCGHGTPSCATHALARIVPLWQFYLFEHVRRWLRRPCNLLCRRSK
jgi:hypothetical protein